MVDSLSCQVSAMLDRMRARETPEQKLERELKWRKRMQEREEEERRRRTCPECRVDLRHGSHTFRCYWRGL